MSSSRRIRSSLVEVSCVTAMSRGRAPSGPVSPSSAASIISRVPKAWRFIMSAPVPRRTRIALFTVFGMSQSLRSRKISWPRAFISRTMPGPSA